MSLVVAWAAVHKKISAVYFTSDSRISWGTEQRWDHAQKVFASPQTSEIFAYAGDVVFPTQTLSQICHASGTGALFAAETQPVDRAQIYGGLISESAKSYPIERLAEPFDILYGCCHNAQFAVFHLSFQRGKPVSFKEAKLPETSDIVYPVLGSGAKLFRTQFEKEAKTSYNAFHAFAKTLDSQVDPKVGGPPQVVSVYNNGETNIYGISYFGSPTILGLDAANLREPKNLEWRNEDFERWDPQAKRLIPGTQRQPRL